MKLLHFTSAELLANQFSTFFVMKIANILNDMNSDSPQDASNITLSRNIVFNKEMLEKFNQLQLTRLRIKL